MSNLAGHIECWLMQYFLTHTGVRMSVEELSKQCLRDNVDLQGRFIWQDIAGSFMHPFTTHHMRHGRLTQSPPDPDLPVEGNDYKHGLVYGVTPRGRVDFTTRLESV